MNIFEKITIEANQIREKFDAKAKAMRESIEFSKREPIALNKGLLEDHRYNEPKGKHRAPEEIISETIESTKIYSRAKELILNAQRKQVGYGLDKYPEPLNSDTWSTVETIDHIIDESIDKLHYLVMLRLKLEQDLNVGQMPCEGSPTHALYADGEKYMSYVGPECDVMHVDLANEVKIDGSGTFVPGYTLEDIKQTAALHSTFAKDDLDAMRYALPADKFVNMAKHTMFEREADKAVSDLMMYNAANRAVILKGPSNTNAFSDVGCKVNDFHKDDSDAMSYSILAKEIIEEREKEELKKAIEDGISNDRF